jgi:cell division protein FtsA
MIIENYQIDEKNYQNLPDNLNCDYLSIDVNFLCLSKNFINNLEDTLKKYQISINQIISARYANNLIQDVDLDLIKKAKLIKNGFNNNEVLLIKKMQKNKGFFEKFFDFFS